MKEFVQFYLQAGAFFDKNVYLMFIILTPCVVKYLVELILNLKGILQKKAKLEQLVELKNNQELKDQRLLDFMIVQIEDELLEACTGYPGCAKTKMIVDFYLANKASYKWRDMKLILSKFEIIEGCLKIKPITALSRIETVLGFAYYGFGCSFVSGSFGNYKSQEPIVAFIHSAVCCFYSVGVDDTCARR